MCVTYVTPLYVLEEIIIIELVCILCLLVTAYCILL